MEHKIRDTKHGFTLVEIIVAMGIFSIVVLIAAGSLLLLVDAQKKAFSLQANYDNLRFSLETIVKDLRTGDFYHCGDASVVPLGMPLDCNGGESVTYTSSAGSQVTYEVFSGRIRKLINESFVGFITPGNVKIENFKFYVVGTDLTDPVYPRVTVVIIASSGSGRSAATFTLQTTIAQRKII